jgi:hypothetical protein
MEELEAGQRCGGMTVAGSCCPRGGNTVGSRHHGEERGAVAQVERKEERRPGQRGGRDNWRYALPSLVLPHSLLPTLAWDLRPAIGGSVCPVSCAVAPRRGSSHKGPAPPLPGGGAHHQPRTTSPRRGARSWSLHRRSKEEACRHSSTCHRSLFGAWIRIYGEGRAGGGAATLRLEKEGEGALRGRGSSTMDKEGRGGGIIRLILFYYFNHL